MLARPARLAGSLLLACSVFTAAQTSAGISSTAQGKTAPSATITCAVRSAPMSPGETAFAQHDLAKAESLLRGESKGTDPESQRAHDTLIRVLLNEEKLTEAGQEAQTWLAVDPHSVWAKVSLFEVQWRKGEVSEATATIIDAAKLDRCNPRLDADWAGVLIFSGMNASAKKELDRAHRLDPIDDDINGSWIQL